MFARYKSLLDPSQRLAKILAVASMLVGFGMPDIASAADEQRFENMKQAMKALAVDIGKTLRSEGLDSIAVKSFEGPAGTSASSRIAQALTDQLKENTRLNVTSAGGAWSVTGEYFAEMNKLSGKLEVFIESTLKNQRGRTQATLITPIITDEQETLTMFGVSADLPTKLTPEQTAAQKTIETVRAETVAAAIDNPQTAIAGARVQADAASPYGLEILVGGQPMFAENREGVAFMPLSMDQVYAVRLINNSDEDVGVTLTIDGINTLEFSKNPGYRELGMWVVGRRSVGVITGWHIVDNQAHSFKVMDYANSVAARLSSTKDIGTITAVFRAAFTGDPPADEPPSTSRGGHGTGFGPPTEQRLKNVVRKFGAVRGAVTVRYDKPDVTELPPAEIPVVAR
jgi:hypothetical protein